MSAVAFVVSALAIAVVLGSVRAFRAQRRRALRIGLQFVAALLLYLCLFPPSAREDFAADELVVLTPGATAAQLAASPAANRIALPGVETDRSLERAPDLATALRRHADARRLRIVGGGLPARDRDAARGRVVAFDAAPLPRGLVELEPPAPVRAGNVWRVAGRGEGVAAGHVELRDPSGAVVASAPLDAQGRFVLNTAAKGEGTALFGLTLLDRAGARVDAIALPLVARAGAALKILLLAGAPDPELKYLRRWAVDAGIELDSRIALSEGVGLTEGAPALDAPALREADLAILDERAWAALDAQSKDALVGAVREGLGLLLRVTGPLPAATATEWAGLGFRAQAVESPPAVTLDRAFGLADSGLVFGRRALAVEADDAAALLRADDGSVLAWSRNLGHGRVALWLLADGYRLGLAGASAAFGTLWSDALAAVARARADATPALPAQARVDERATFCSVGPDAAVEDAAGTRSDLVVDATEGCVAYWPGSPGWHVLSSGGRRWPFFVRARGEAAALQAGETARATRELIGASTSAAAAASRRAPLPRWPFFLGWLAAVVALWWSERGGAHDSPHIAAPGATR